MILPLKNTIFAYLIRKSGNSTLKLTLLSNFIQNRVKYGILGKLINTSFHTFFSFFQFLS